MEGQVIRLPAPPEGVAPVQPARPPPSRALPPFSGPRRAPPPAPRPVPSSPPPSPATDSTPPAPSSEPPPAADAPRRSRGWFSRGEKPAEPAAPSPAEKAQESKGASEAKPGFALPSLPALSFPSSVPVYAPALAGVAIAVAAVAVAWRTGYFEEKPEAAEGEEQDEEAALGQLRSEVDKIR